MEFKLQLNFTPAEWETTILPLAEETLATMRERGMHTPKRISKAGMVRLAFGLRPAQWGDGERLNGHRPNEKQEKEHKR